MTDFDPALVEALASRDRAWWATSCDATRAYWRKRTIADLDAVVEAGWTAPLKFVSPDCRGKGCAACNRDAWDEGGPGRPEGLTACTHHCHRKDTP